jgi:hypothetical protein
MTVGIGQVLKLLDMIPDKKGKRTFIEKLPSAQKLDGGNLSALMAKLQSGGLASLFQNPLSALMGPLQQLISAVMGAQGGGGAGSNPFAAAVGGPGGLSDAVQRLADVSARLSGTVPPGEGQFGFADLALHEGVLDQLGTSAPASMALAVAAAPLNTGDLLSRVANTVYRNNVSIANRLTTPSDAAVDVITHTAEINAILDASYLAIYQGEAFAQDIAQVQTAAGMLVAGSPALQNLIKQCLKPETARIMNAAMADRLTIRPPDVEKDESAPATMTVCY